MSLSNRFIITLLAGLLLIFLFSTYFWQHSLTSTVPELEGGTEQLKDGRQEGPHLFAEFHRQIRTREGEEAPAYEPGYRLRAYRKALRLRTKTIDAEPLPWIERGPGNVGGRTRGLWVDPADTTYLTWFAGSVGGGVWKTENGGFNWRHLTDELNNLSTATITGSAANPDVLYVGTGEGFPGGASITGNGIWKSTDGGESWFVLESTVNDPRFANIMRMVADPRNENEIVVATRVHRREERADEAPLSYIMKSTDGGVTWVETYATTPTSVAQQLILHPLSFDTLYAAVNGIGVVRSVDRGDSWEVLFDGTGLELGRIEMAISPSEPHILYFSAYTDAGVSKLYRSEDGGRDWYEVVGIDARNRFGNWMGSQGWYNNTIAVHPFDPNTVLVGGQGAMLQITVTEFTPDTTGLLKGILTPVTDAYEQYASRFNTSSKGVHVDHHNLILIPIDESTGRFYIINANDGGVAFSPDSGESFTQTGDLFSEDGRFPSYKGYNTSQFYGVDKMNGASRYVGGTQDNGSWVSAIDADAASSWLWAPSGDGFEAAWHYEDPNKILESSQYNNIYRSLDGGRTWRNIRPPGNGPFITRIANSKIEPDMVFCISSTGVIRSLNFGDDWEIISMPEEWKYGGSTTLVRFSLASPLVVWSGAGLTENSRLAVSRDGGATFTATNFYDRAKLGSISGLATHPSNESTAYALFSMANGPKVLRTTDFGATWSDISGFNGNVEDSSNGFPDVATYSLLVMPFDTNRIWAGTEIGLFESLDGGLSWQYADNGLPPVSIWEMKIVNDEVVLATHGRGVWSVALPELAGYEPPAPKALLPRLELIGSGLGGEVIGDYFLRSAYDSSHIKVEIFGENETVANARRIDLEKNEAPAQGRFNLTLTDLPADTLIQARVTLQAYKNGVELINSTQALVFEVEARAVNSYSTDFDDDRRDFARLGFNIYQEAGFADKALHSPHPYQGFYQTYIAVLQYPVIVSQRNPTISFDEIVMVEPGEPGTVFGDFEFWDYVAVQGTKDRGLTWDVIEGYDVRWSENWESNYDQNATSVDSRLMETHTMDLTTVYEPGDTIFLQFILQSDPYVQGWGWVIDNLNIQSGTTDSRSVEPAPVVEIAVYPNPAGDWIKLGYTLSDRQAVRIELYNINGQRLSTLERTTKQRGAYQHELDVSSLEPGLYLFRFEAGGRVQTVRWVKM